MEIGEIMYYRTM